jgi:hypothetical protein
MRRLASVLAVALLVALSAAPAVAGPWAAPGDPRLRHDLQLLSDAGLLKGTSVSWPIGWSQVARDLGGVDASQLPDDQRASLERLRERLAREMRVGHIGVTATASGAVDPTPIRTFESIPREEGEASLAADWMDDRFAVKLSAQFVTDPPDNQSWRPDGSYAAVVLGNWIASAGYLDRWWGPGWQGSLILSNNARPVPAISIDRNESTPFDVPILRWLGPWRLSTFMGQLEGNRDYSHALLWGLRGEIRPHPTLQIGVSRTAQWCGEGRPCGWGTFWDLLTGNDNDQPLAKQPGNQLAGYDVRWSWPGARVPLALYAQAIGEDEAGGLPSKFLGLFGAEVWGQLGGGSWRAHLEYADTACDFLSDPPEFGCAYTNVIYTTGYRYRGRVQGHSIDADGESLGLGAMFVEASGHRWELLLRDMKINRAGVAPGDSLADAPVKAWDAAITHERAFEWGNMTVSLGYMDVDAEGSTILEDGMRGFVTWRHALR